MHVCTCKIIYVPTCQQLEIYHSLTCLLKNPSLIHRHRLDKLIHLRHRRLLHSFELPRIYAKSFIKSANNDKWDRFNPRSLAWSPEFQTSVPAKVYSRCEHALAAYQACMAHALAVVLGTFAELRAIMLNTLPVLYLVVEVVCIALIFARSIVSGCRDFTPRRRAYALFRHFWLRAFLLLADGRGCYR